MRPPRRDPDDEDEPDLSGVDPDELAEALEHVENHDRDQWLRVGMALEWAGRRGLEDARLLWDDWSEGQDYPDYSDEAQETAWRSFGGDGVRLATVYRLARQGGWRGGPDPGLSSREARRESRVSAREDFRAISMVESRTQDELERERDERGPADDPDHEGISDREQVLRRLNQRYAFVAIGKGVVADLRDPDDLTLLSQPAFVGKLAHPRIESHERADGSWAWDGCGKVWLTRYPRRKTYDKIDFRPPGVTCPRTVLNRWTGWATRPDPTVDVSLYLDHVRDVVCSGDDDLYWWVVAWMAHLVQVPSVKPGTAIVLRGREGVGKGQFFQMILGMLGRHGYHVTNYRHLTSQFNAHLANALFVFADEVTWGGRKQEESVLKTLITEKRTSVEMKGIDATTQRSYVRVGISSNEGWAVPAGESARRLTVLDVERSRPHGDTHWRDLARLIDGPGPAGTLAYLASLRLEDLPDPRICVKTEALADQKVRSMDGETAWIYSCLQARRISEHWENDWPWDERTRASGPELRRSYLRHAQDQGLNRRETMAVVNMKIKQIFKDQARQVRMPRDDDGDRPMGWELPGLRQARQMLEDHLDQPIPWPDRGRDQLE